MNYKQKYLKYKQKYLRLLKDQKGGEPFLTDLQAKQAYLWLFAKNQRQLDFTERSIRPIISLGNITLNHQYRLSLLTKGSLSVVLASKLVPKYLRKRIISRIHIVPHISPLTCVVTRQVSTYVIKLIAFHPTLHLLATGSMAIVTLWDCSDLQNIHQVAILGDYGNYVLSIAFHQTLPLLAIGSDDRIVRLWDFSNRQSPTIIKNLYKHREFFSRSTTFNSKPVLAVAFHPTLPLLATGSDDGSVRLWDLIPQNTYEVNYLGRFPSDVNSIAFHPTLPFLASGFTDGTITLRNCSNPQRIYSVADLHGHTDWINSIAFHPTLPLLASGSRDKTVKLWNFSDPENTHEVANLSGHTSGVNSVAFHPTLQLLASGSNDRTIKLWNCSDPENTHEVANLSEHTSGVNSVAFHPTLQLLASGSNDRTIKLWEF